MKVSRRSFIKSAAATVLLGALGTAPLLRQANATPLRRSEGVGRTAEQPLWTFLVDTKRCIGCGRCVLACKLENRVPAEPELSRTWVERYVITEDGRGYTDSPKAGIDGFSGHPDTKYRNLAVARSFFVPKLCNQCDNPPCVPVCPVAATYRTKDGIVLIDQSRCIGCRYCIIACPYGARYFLPDSPITPTGHSRVVDKCTWCYHRITKGLLPACVEACPVQARLFGDLRDAEGLVSRILKEKEFGVLKPALGTKPKVYYVDLPYWVQ